MKLEYLDDISNGGKFKDVVSENLIRLYDFDQKETTLLIKLIYQRLILDNQSVDLAAADFIQPINCHLNLQLASIDEGVVKTDKDNFFICKLTAQTYVTATEYMKAIDSGYNWLCDTSDDNIDFLYSAGGTW